MINLFLRALNSANRPNMQVYRNKFYKKTVRYMPSPAPVTYNHIVLRFLCADNTKMITDGRVRKPKN